MLRQTNASPQARPWHYAWIALAFLYAIPITHQAYARLVEVTHKARAELIMHHRLWELHPDYKGKPEAWTRSASRLLTDRQLMRRVYAKYGEAARQIELEYRGDLTIAQAEVIVAATAIWALPLAGLYGIGFLIARRRRRPSPPPAPAPPRRDDSRYRP
jgi:hypothetical protein